MRRSLGGGGGGGGGRNMGGGNGIIRTVQRAVRAGVGGGAAPPEPFSPSANTTINATTNSRKAKNLNKKHPISPSTALTLSSSSSSSAGNNSNGTSAFSSLINLPLSSSSSSLGCGDESEWECVDESEDGRARLFYEDYVFGTVPSRDEVHHAVSALQQAVSPSSCICSPKRKLAEDSDKDVTVNEVSNPIDLEKGIASEIDSVEPSLHLCHSKMYQFHGSDGVYDAFHLLETEPSVQRMVISLSSDKAVWDAVLNNEAVKELRGSISHNADSLIEESLEKGSDDSNPVKDILSWIFTNGKAKITQLIDKIMKIVNEAFQVSNEEKKGDSTDPIEEKLKTSLWLSVMVLIIVVITRIKTA